MGYLRDAKLLWQCPCGKVREVSGSQLNAGIRFCSPYCGKRGTDEKGTVLMDFSRRYGGIRPDRPKRKHPLPTTSTR